jgi:hypothetical protein
MGSRKPKLVALFNLIGFGQFFPAYLCFVHPSASDISVIINIVGCSFLPAAGILNIITEHQNKNEIDWKICLTYSILNLIGDFCYPLASIFTWPDFGDLNGVGVWLFRIGGCCYLIENCLRIHKILRKPCDEELYEIYVLLFFVSLQYTAGLCCFLIAGVFLQTKIEFNVELWLMGSSFFMSGAILDLSANLFD